MTGVQTLKDSKKAKGQDADLSPLRLFIQDMAHLVSKSRQEAEILDGGGERLAALIQTDDWLPELYRRPHPDRYQQYLLHCDSLQRFSIVSFVWGPGQTTPVHDHRIWGLVGVLSGAERVESFTRIGGKLVADGPPSILKAGEIDAVSPRIGDIHRVSNALDDQISVSIHVYGANIGTVRRHIYDAEGNPGHFVSGYADQPLPNIWQPTA